MSTRSVSGHYRNGQRVRAYRQGGPSSGQRAVDAGLGTLASAGVLTSIVLDTVGLLINVTGLLIAAIAGSLLGVRFYKRTRRRPWSKRRHRLRLRRRRMGGPPATRPHSAPWGGSAPWGDRGGLWRVEDGKLRRVRGSS